MSQYLLPFSHLDMTEFGAFFTKILIHEKKLNCGGMESQSKVKEGINSLFYLACKGSCED